MVNKPGKPKSKRTPVRLRHKIEKAGAAKARKQKKLAKKDPQWRSRLKKDPGIPNLFPYKEQILRDLEANKRRKEEERASERVKNGATEEVIQESDHDAERSDGLEDMASPEVVIEDVEADGTTASANPMSALLASARARAEDFREDATTDEGEDSMDVDGGGEGTDVTAPTSIPTATSRKFDPSSRSFQKVFRHVLENSDIVLYVLDARDPDGTCSREIENEIASSGDGNKRLILVLNKIDLIPPSTLQAWLKILRRRFPTLPLRANTSASNAHTFEHKALTIKATSETLVRALKSYSQSERPKQTTTVGIVGYPNVGKSSVINALTSRLGSTTRARTACPVGAEAGVTTAVRTVKLDNKLKLLDSPGIVFPSSGQSASGPSHLTQKQLEQAHLTLLAALPPAAIDDPLPAVTLLMYRLSHSSITLSPLMEYYNINQAILVPENGDLTTDFLVQVARKRGRLGKGGVPNLNAAGMTVLTDWRDGRIRGWMEAPADVTNSAGRTDAIHDNKEIVQQWSKEFKLDGLWGEEEAADPGGAVMEQ